MRRTKRRKRVLFRQIAALFLVVLFLAAVFVVYQLGGLGLQKRPKQVRGVYLPTESLADDARLDQSIEVMKKNRLNTVVIDFKDDDGQIVTQLEEGDELVKSNSLDLLDLQDVLRRFKRAGIYPIARIVCFKDNRLSQQYPDLSFISQESGMVWQDGGGASYINPMKEEVKTYLLDVTEAAYDLGFKEVQYDYIRFPEGFHVYSDGLWYDSSTYEDLGGLERVQGINDFLERARNRFQDRDLTIGAAVFGYATIGGDQPDLVGIGQNFKSMAERVDVISAMIYPSHWSPGFLGVDYPDLEPYEVVAGYIDIEQDILDASKSRTRSIPWLQAFTDYSLAEGTYQEYGAEEINEQIRALKDKGQEEFFLWNIAGDYPSGIRP